MALVVPEDVLKAFAAVWPTTGVFAGVPLNAHAKQPNEAAASYGVLKVTETEGPKSESDGLTEQTWRVEVAVWSSTNPAPGTFGAALSALYDGTPAAPGAGLTIDSTKFVTLVQPAAASLQRDRERRGGADVLAAGRAWTVTTSATQ